MFFLGNLSLNINFGMIHAGVNHTFFWYFDRTSMTFCTPRLTPLDWRSMWSWPRPCFTPVYSSQNYRMSFIVRWLNNCLLTLSPTKQRYKWDIHEPTKKCFLKINFQYPILTPTGYHWEIYAWIITGICKLYSETQLDQTCWKQFGAYSKVSFFLCILKMYYKIIE